MSNESVTDADWLDEAACYFEKRPTGSEDMAFWANVSNAERCRSIAQSLRSKPVAGVEVKPLAWHGPDVNGDIHARSILAVYTIRKQQGSLGYWLTEVGGYHSTIEKAKVAAEADYRQRILSTLSLPAQEPVAWLSKAYSGPYAGDFEVASHKPDRSPFNSDWGDWFAVYASPQPEAVITEEMVERVAAKLRSSVFPGETATNLARELLEAALKEA